MSDTTLDQNTAAASGPDETESLDVVREDFIREIVAADQRSGKYGGKVLTRFPPEPNGWLHIGHAKSICLNFGVAEDFGGLCNLRFDDTNPETEDPAYVEAIQRDIRWLGFDWEDRLFFASDYFENFYECAVRLIQDGKAYVDSQNEEEIRAHRGTVTEPGAPSPYRERSVEENLDLLARMRAGEFADGAHILRAKIDMAAANMKMRDPLLYRIRHADHYRTGDAWCIYPMYDFAHPISDALEGVTHSICTLEFENNRDIYDWLVDNLFPEPRPRQYEFARLNIDYTVMSKRKLLQLVEEGYVDGWDDPRMLTIAGMRRRGITPEAIRAFSDRIGVAKTNSRVETSLFEYSIRDDLNYRAPRVMAVLRPLKVVIENYPEGQTEEFDAPLWPRDVPREGARPVPFAREIYIERDDFMENPPSKYFRLAPGREVRLRYAYIIRCERVVHDPDTGEVVEIRASYDPETRGGEAPAGRKVRGTIHWVSAQHAVPAQVRLYDRLFLVPNPDDAEEGKTFKDYLNPDSLEIVDGALVEPSIAVDPPGSRYQFERLGYFISDEQESQPGHLVYNRIITLRDSWAKAAAEAEQPAEPAAQPSAVEPNGGAPEATGEGADGDAEGDGRKSRTEVRDELRGETPVLQERLAYYTDVLGLPFEEADVLTGDLALATFFDDGLATYDNARSLAKWMTNEVMRELKERDLGDLPFSGGDVARLARLVDDGAITAGAGRDVFAQMATRRRRSRGNRAPTGARADRGRVRAGAARRRNRRSQCGQGRAVSPRQDGTAGLLHRPGHARHTGRRQPGRSRTSGEATIGVGVAEDSCDLRRSAETATCAERGGYSWKSREPHLAGTDQRTRPRRTEAREDAHAEAEPQEREPPEIHIVSGGVGASAELLTHTVLVQYPDVRPKLIVHAHVHDLEDVPGIVERVAATNGIILHTLVNAEIREGLIAEAARRGVDAIDLAGPLMQQLSARLQAQPIGQPGLYRKLYDQYFKRVDAIEFTIAHDDGQRRADLGQADIVLMGVSRLGKTPLSVYLAMQGWKVANVPFVPGVELPAELWTVDRRRIVGLTIEPPQLAVHRRWREKRLGVDADDYVDQKQIAGELREANRFFSNHDIPVVDVTDKPIETSGAEIEAVVTRSMRSTPKSALGSKKA